MDEPTERDRQRMRKVAALHIQDAKAIRLRGKPLAAYDLTFDELLGLLGYAWCMLEVERKAHSTSVKILRACRDDFGGAKDE